MKVNRLNPLFLFCYREGLTASKVSKDTGIERTRIHRLIHSQRFLLDMKVGELKSLMKAYPRAEFDLFD